MTDFGEKLRRQRESRNITLRDISESTKINKRYLEALERNDFDALPGGVFTKGYIRTYAESIGLDPELLLEDYRSERRAKGEEDPSEDEKVAKEAAKAALSQLATSIDHPSTGRRLILPIILGCALLAIIAWAAIHYLAPGSTEVEAAKSTPMPATAETIEQEAESVPDRTEPPEQVVAEVAEPEVEAAPSAVEPDRPAIDPVSQPAIEVAQPLTEQAVPIPEQEAAAEEAPAPEPEVAIAPAPSAADLTIPEHGVGNGLVNRELVGRSDSFREGETVWFWTRVVGGKRGDSIRHVWLHDGDEAGVIGLQIGGAHWRTQSRRQLRQGSAGRWSVEARDAQGRLLAKTEFTCLPAD